MRNGVSESHLAALAQSRDRKESTLLSGRYLPSSFKSNTNAKPGNDIDQLQECRLTSMFFILYNYIEIVANACHAITNKTFICFFCLFRRVYLLFINFNGRTLNTR